MGVNLFDVVCMKISHNVIDAFQRSVDIFSITPVDPVKIIFRVRIVQRKESFRCSNFIDGS